jgi:hypothetical protein
MRCFITNRDCKHEPPDPCHATTFSLKELEAGDIFMISPFGFPFDDLLHHGISETINRAAKGKTVVTRGDKALQLGYVICQRICRKIRAARWVFADLTEPNGNVYYELGLAYGMNRGIVLLSSERSINPYRRSFIDHNIPMLEYSRLSDLKSEKLYEEYLAHAFLLSEDIKEELKPHAVLDKPPTILNVLAEDCPSLDLHHEAIKSAIQDHDSEVKPNEPRLEDWHVETLPVGIETNIVQAVKLIAQAKICLFDTTHYEDKPNAMIFFLLGVAHAAEREGIPLVNAPLNRNIPFDIRGLWQVNFQNADQLRSELRLILPTIDSDFKKDKADNPYRRVWDPFLKNKELHVITCARENVADNLDRGARTDIDLWDFTSVSQLSFFIAQKYESANVPIEHPRNKESSRNLKEIDLAAFQGKRLDDLRQKFTVIIGSPDVSDYAEAVLADLYDFKPYAPRENSIGMPFVFIKHTKAIDHPRRMSAFYRLPGENECEKVEFGQPIRINECGKRLVTRDGVSIYNRTTYVVITIAETRDGYRRMVISGFTGIATYAAMQLLTDPKSKTELEKYLAEFENKLKEAALSPTVGVNILISVDYSEPASSEPPGDQRKLGNIAFVDLELIPRPSSWPSYCQIEHA